MSLVVDLLSKIKPTGRKGEVPPTLKRAISENIEGKAVRKKFITFSGLILIFIIAGFGVVYYIETGFEKSSPKYISRVGRRPVVTSSEKKTTAKKQSVVTSSEKQPVAKKQLPVKKSQKSGKSKEKDLLKKLAKLKKKVIAKTPHKKLPTKPLKNSL